MNPNEKPNHALDEDVAPIASKIEARPSEDPQYPSFSQLNCQNPMNDPKNHAEMPKNYDKPQNPNNNNQNQQNYRNQPPQYPNQPPQYPPYQPMPPQQPNVYYAQSPMVMPMAMPYYPGYMPYGYGTMPMGGPQTRVVVLPPGYKVDHDSGYSPFGNVFDEMNSLF